MQIITTKHVHVENTLILVISIQLNGGIIATPKGAERIYIC